MNPQSGRTVKLRLDKALPAAPVFQAGGVNSEAQNHTCPFMSLSSPPIPFFGLMKPEILKLNLSASEKLALALIDENNTITNRQLADGLNITRRGVIKLLGRLRRANLLRVPIEPAGKRKIVVCLKQAEPAQPAKLAEPAREQPVIDVTDETPEQKAQRLEDELRECYHTIRRDIGKYEDLDSGYAQLGYNRHIHDDACRGLDLLKELGEPEARNELRQWFENIRNAAKTTGALIKYGLASRDRALCKKVDKLIDLASQATPERLAILAASIPDDWQLADTSVKQLALTVSPSV